MTTTAQAIVDQVGRKAFVMMGSDHIVADDLRIAFSVRGSRVKKIVIQYEVGLDTYTVRFYNRTMQMVHESENIYADGLHQCIEANTGLSLSL